MKTIDMLKKTLVPSVLAMITVHSYRRLINSQHKEFSQERAEYEPEINTMQENLRGEELAKDELRITLEGAASSLKTVDEEKGKYVSTISGENTDRSTDSLPTSESSEPLTSWESYYDAPLTKASSSKDGIMKEILDHIDQNRKGPSQSNVLDTLSELISQVQSVVDTLSLEQLVALFNISVNVVMLFTLTSISTLLIGDYLIDKFNLDKNYPKLSKIIKFKKALNKHYTLFYIVFFFIVVILSIIGNLYMLLLKYFV